MIILRQKEFNSKAQKARRAKFDTRVAKEMYGGTEGATNNSDQLKRVGRAKAKRGTIRIRENPERLAYDSYSHKDLSNNTKNAILDATKGKRGATDEIWYRAMEQKTRQIDPKKRNSATRLLNKLDAIEKKAAKTAKLKTAGKVGLGVVGAAGIGYGIKKAIDKKKDYEKEDKK